MEYGLNSSINRNTTNERGNSETSETSESCESIKSNSNSSDSSLIVHTSSSSVSSKTSDISEIIKSSDSSLLIIEKKKNHEELKKENSQSEISQEDCCICLDDLIGEICILTCGHQYHFDCITEWIKKLDSVSIECPICRKNSQVLNVYWVENTTTSYIDNYNYDNSMFNSEMARTGNSLQELDNSSEWVSTQTIAVSPVSDDNDSIYFETDGQRFAGHNSNNFSSPIEYYQPRDNRDNRHLSNYGALNRNNSSEFVFSRRCCNLNSCCVIL